jgi:hypothetical protein
MFHSVQELDGKNMEMSGDGTEVFMRKEDQLFLGGEYVCLRCGDVETSSIFKRKKSSLSEGSSKLTSMVL